MALYNGILKEAAINQGDAARLTETLSGAQARLGATAREAGQSLGQALEPVVKRLIDSITPVVEGIRDWVKANPKLAANLTTLAAVIAGFTATLATLGTIIPSVLAGFTALRTASLFLAGSPIGALILGVTTLGGLFVQLSMQEATARAEAERHRREREAEEKRILALTEQYQDLKETLDSSTASTEDKKIAITELKRVTEELGKLMPDVVTVWDAEGRAIHLNTLKVKENEEALKRAIKTRQALNTYILFEKQQELDAAERALQEAQRLKAHGPGLPPMGSIAQNPYADDVLYAQGKIDQLKKEIADLQGLIAGTETAPEGKQGGGRSTNNKAPGPTSKDQAYSNPALDAALENLWHLKAINEMSLADEEEYLQRVLAKHVKTAEEKRAVEEMLYNVRRQIREKAEFDEEEARRGKLQGALRFLEHEKRMGRLNVEDEIAGLQL